MRTSIPCRIDHFSRSIFIDLHKKLVPKIESFYFSLLCRCAAVADQYHFWLFGITDTIKCWGFSRGSWKLTGLEKSSHCINARKTRATCKEKDLICAGTSKDHESLNYNSSFIYEVPGNKFCNFQPYCIFPKSLPNLCMPYLISFLLQEVNSDSFILTSSDVQALQFLRSLQYHCIRFNPP